MLGFAVALSAALGAGCLFLAGLLALTYYWVDRLPVILGLAIHFLLAAGVWFGDAVATGANPLWDKADLPLVLLFLRVGMGVNLAATSYFQAKRFWQARGSKE